MTQGKLLFVQLNLFWAGNSDIHQQLPMQQTLHSWNVAKSRVPRKSFKSFQLHGFLLLPQGFDPEAKTQVGIIVFRTYIYSDIKSTVSVHEISSWLK